MNRMKESTIEFGYRLRQRRWIIATILLGILAVLLLSLILFLGSTSYSLQTVLRVLGGENIPGAFFTIRTLRLPRMLAAMLCGFAFGIAGSTFQTMLRNPLANPNIIGVTSGASAAAVFCIIVWNAGRAVTSLAAVIASLAVTALIYLLSRGKAFSGGRLILIGIGVQAMLNSVISYLLLKASQNDVPTALRWLSGSLNGIQMQELPALVLAFAGFVPVILILGKKLSLLELGEQTAITLGINADRTRLILILASVCLIAFATSITGPIAFVALLAGPIARRLVGANFPVGLPAGLVGIILVAGADVIGQLAFHTRFPAGVITGILGAPYLIFLLIRMNRKGEL